MKTASLMTFAVMVTFGLSSYAQPLNLGSSSSSIRSKSHAIETEYSQSMRDRQRGQIDPDNLPHMGALTVEEAPIQQNRAVAVETEETHSAPLMSAPTATPRIHTIPGAQNSYFGESSTSTSTYTSNLKMRDERKVGVGISAGGQLGVAALNMEFNFEDADGVLAGFGAGPGYHTVGLAWKHSFEGRYLSPYTTAGYSRWYNSRGLSSEFKHSNVLDRVLTDAEKRDGRFATDFVNASLGLQFNQLKGDLAGLSVFAELTAMYEVNRSMLIPNGGVGALYYF